MRTSLGALFLLGWACAAAAEPRLADLMNEARATTHELIGQIRGELARELERTGPLRAIIVCKYTAPEATSAISRRTGMRVTRVSLRPRNPSLGEPDAWEQRILLDFEKRAGTGEKSGDLEFAQIVAEPAGRFFRYMKAITMDPACAICHGKNVSEGIQAQLATEYPHDSATGLDSGALRGAMSIKKRLP